MVMRKHVKRLMDAASLTNRIGTEMTEKKWHFYMSSRSIRITFFREIWRLKGSFPAYYVDGSSRGLSRCSYELVMWFLNLKPDICNTCMNIRHHRRMAVSLFMDAWFIRYASFVHYWVYDTHIWLFGKS